MIIQADTSAVSRIDSALARAWKTIGLLTLLSLGLTVVVGSSGPIAHAAQGGAGFCQIDDPSKLAKRAGTQSPRDGIQLLANHREVAGGEVISARLVNVSDAIVLYGAEFRIQRYRGGMWRIDPSSPDGPWPRSAKKLKPGETGACYRYIVPEGQPAGRYRFLTMVSRGSREYPQVAKFDVRGHSE